MTHTNEYGQYLCPLPGHDCMVDRQLYAEHTANVPLLADAREHSASGAVSTAWRVTCAAGHVVLTSRGLEDAEPLNADVLVAVLDSLTLISPDEVTMDPCPHCGSWCVRDVPAKSESELAGCRNCNDCGWNDRDGHPLDGVVAR